MKNCKIVFDTNAYRTFITPKNEEETKKRITQLIQLEKSKNIKALLASDVAVELYSHLDDLNNKDYNTCKNSVIAQYMHSLQGDSPRYILNSDIHLCNLVLGEIPDLSRREQLKMLKMSYYLYTNSTPDHLKGYTENFKKIRQFSDEKKAEFVNNLKKFQNDLPQLKTKLKTVSAEDSIIIQNEMSSLKTELTGEISIDKLANGLLIRAASTLGIDLKKMSKETIHEKREFIKTNFLVSIIFFRNILRSVIDSSGSYGFDDPKKGNSFWDYQLTFQVNKYVDDEKLIFVTDDKRFRTAVKEAGLVDSIISLEEYLNAIGYSS